MAERNHNVRFYGLVILVSEDWRQILSLFVIFSVHLLYDISKSLLTAVGKSSLATNLKK